MTIISKQSHQSRCECCGKRNTIIQRRYNGEAYCPNCYRTWFVHKPCYKCGKTHKAHKRTEHSICRYCKINEPCTRCAGNAVKNGANTKYGRVCSTCYQGYFKPKKRCHECGEMKRNISSYHMLKAIGYNHQICTTCYGKFFHSTCNMCHRHRKVTEQVDGLKLCKKCLEDGLVACNTCRKLIPAGIGKRCWDCYWQEKLDKEVHLNTFLFHSKKVKKSYQEFTQYLLKNKGAKVAKLKNNNFIEFFIRCDDIWGDIPNYRLLAEEFKPEGLRKNLTVLRWLIDSKRVVEDIETKDRVAEEERIIRLLEKLENLPEVIKSYYEFLMRKHRKRKTSLKTVRMSLQPVIGIYNMFQLKGLNTPNQEQIDTYLLEKKGQFNSLYGFVTFLNNEYNKSLVCNKPNKKDIEKADRLKLEKKIIAMSLKDKPLDKKEKLVWLQLTMAYFHNTQINLKMLKSITLKQGSEDMDVLTYKGQDYWLPKYEQNRV